MANTYFQTFCWTSSARSTKKGTTPTYHLLYPQKSAVAKQPPASAVTSRREAAYKTERLKAAKIRFTREETDVMERPRVPPVLPFNNSLYPHLKAKTATGLKARPRRAPSDEPADAALTFRRVPQLQPSLRSESTFCSTVLYAHLQEPSEVSKSSSLPVTTNSGTASNGNADFVEAKPPPFVIRQKLAQQFRDLTRLKGERYDGTTLMGFGNDRLREVIDSINSQINPSSQTGASSQRSQTAAESQVSSNSKPSRRMVLSTSRSSVSETSLNDAAASDYTLVSQPTAAVDESVPSEC